MNNQYPPSPAPGQPNPNQGNAGQPNQWQDYLARRGQGYGQNPDQPSGSAYSAGQFSPAGDAFGASSSGIFGGGVADSGPFSSGGTTSFFGSGGQKQTSAWGTPVGGNNAGGGQVPPPGGPYSNYYNPRNRRQSSSMGVVIVVILVVAMIAVGAFFVARDNNGREEDPVPLPTSSQSSAPTPSATQTSGVPTNPGDDLTPTSGAVNGQNEDGSVTVGSWKVEKLEFLPDASERLVNLEEPVEAEPSHHFAGIKMRFTNNGAVASSPAFNVGITVYFGDGDRAWEEMSIYEAESVQSLEPIEPGESIEGWFYAQVPEGYTGGELGFFDYDNSENVDSDLTLP